MHLIYLEETMDDQTEISAESIIHRELRELADYAYKKHGLIINNVYFNWKDIDSVDNPNSYLGSIEVSIITKK